MMKTNVRKELGATIRAYRQRLGISQETLAERAELHRTYVTDVERGSRNISLESISRLAQALGLSIASLFPTPRPSRADRANSAALLQDAVDILLVEDNPKDIELTLQAFKAARLSNHVEIVSDGQEALDFVFRQGSFARRADIPGRSLVVLLDLRLPKVDGLEVLRRLQAHRQTKNLQVIVLTNSQDNADVATALRLEAAAYIVKPLDFQSFSSITPQLNFSWTLLNPGPGQAAPRTRGRRSLKT
jgi:two-component system response regulator